MRNAIWHDDMTLGADEVKKSPGKGRVHHNLGRVYDQAHLPRKAFNEYIIATYLQPDLALAHQSLGISYVSRGMLKNARQELETALQLDPSLGEARTFLDFISQQNSAFPRK